MAPALPIIDPAADAARNRRDARTLSDAQRLADGGEIEAARVALAALAETPVTSVRAQAALLFSGLCLMRGLPQDALAALERVPAQLVADPGFASMVAAAALRQLGRYPEALARAERALEHGETPGRLLVLADAQKHAGQLPDAIATLERVLASAPHDATALAQLAGYLFLSRDRTLAASIEERFEACAPDNAESDRGRAFIALTRADLDAAIASLERAFEREPEQTRAYVKDEVELQRFASDPRIGALQLR
jgi:tetratricopeptide (TPR) repeat protein